MIIVRKIRQILGSLYKVFIMPIKCFIIEITTCSHIRQGVLLEGKVELKGNNFIGHHSYLIETEIGYASYITNDGYFFNTVIGKYSSIGNHVKIIAGTHPIRIFASTHPAFYSLNTPMSLSYVNSNRYEEYKYVIGTKTSVIIGNDVWIGSYVKIMEGVQIGDGAIIGANSLVTKNAEPYGIYVGNPAKLIRYRFPKEDIDRLLQFQWWNKDENWIKENADKFRDVSILLNSVER